MHVQIQQHSLSILLDVISKFLSKVLAKDSKCSYYLKQWTSFKQLLSSSPLDINPILSHLSNLNNLSSESARPSSYEGGSFHRNQLSIEIDNKFNTNFDTKKILKNIEIETPTQKMIFPHLAKVVSTRNSPELKRYRSDNYFEHLSNDIMSNGSDVALKKIPSDNKSTSGQDIFEYRKLNHSPIRRDFSPIRGYNATYSIFKNDGGGAQSNGIKHNIGFLTQRARRMKDNMDYHTNDLVGVIQGKKALMNNNSNKVWHQRSELRKVKYYAQGNWL